jgi:hypothetical protein
MQMKQKNIHMFLFKSDSSLISDWYR